jgi:phage terminase large subunit-like protein
MAAIVRSFLRRRIVQSDFQGGVSVDDDSKALDSTSPLTRVRPAIRGYRFRCGPVHAVVGSGRAMASGNGNGVSDSQMPWLAVPGQDQACACCRELCQ